MVLAAFLLGENVVDHLRDQIGRNADQDKFGADPDPVVAIDHRESHRE